MIQIVNGFEISLAKQYLMIDLFLPNSGIAVFQEQKKFKSELMYDVRHNY